MSSAQVVQLTLIGNDAVYVQTQNIPIYICVGDNYFALYLADSR